MTLHISYVSDVLCIWAYVAEVRLDEVRKEFGSSVELEYRFIPIFGATRHRIAEGRKDRALGIFLVRRRIAEQCQNAIAHVLGDKATVVLDDR